MNSIKTFLALSVFSALMAGSASAISYSASDDGTVAPDGSEFVAKGGSLALKSQAGYSFLGVSGGSSGNEIDLNQSITINFDTAQIFTSLYLGLLFDGPEYGDKKEVAVATANGTTVFKLTALTEDTASWLSSGAVVPGASVSVVSKAKEGLGGLWNVSNPFGDLLVTSLILNPQHSCGSSDSDFGLTSFNTKEPEKTPDAGSTLSLFGLLALGLAGAARRFRR